MFCLILDTTFSVDSFVCLFVNVSVSCHLPSLVYETVWSDFIMFFIGLLLEVGYGGKLEYHDQPRSIKTKQDQPRLNQGQINENQSLALIALALFWNIRSYLPLEMCIRVTQ